MSKTRREQDVYDYMHDNKILPNKRLVKLLRYFNRCNFWDWDMKMQYRKIKDFRRGGIARIKGKNYKKSR